MIVPSWRAAAVIWAFFAALLSAVPASAQSNALEEATKLFKQGQFERALERVESHLKTNPRDARGRFLKGLIYAEQRKPDDAIKVFTELTQEYPELPEPYNNLAVLYASQGQYEKARSALEMAIRTHPSYATAHENLGDIYAKMASQAYDKALQLDKANAPLQTKLNLIKDLFVGSERPSKPGTGKPEAAKLALSTPTQEVSPPVTQPQAKTPAAAAKSAPVKTAPAKPAPAKAPAKPASNPEEVLSALNMWAKAWSENDVPGYLSHYATDFKTPNGEPRASWEAQRKARIAKPRKIQVDVESPKVVFSDSGRVTVTFRQRYRSDDLNISSSKTLVMVKMGDRWLIQQERVGS